MSFDTDNQRCDMALAINCKDGDRPDWKPPANCKNYIKHLKNKILKSAFIFHDIRLPIIQLVYLLFENFPL